MTMLCLFLIQIIVRIALTKDLHIKEALNKETRSIGDDFKESNNYNGVITNNERFARHLEAVTESIIEHIVKELRRLRPNIQSKDTSRVITQLKRKLKKRRTKIRDTKKRIRKGKNENRTEVTNH